MKSRVSTAKFANIYTNKRLARCVSMERRLFQLGVGIVFPPRVGSAELSTISNPTVHSKFSCSLSILIEESTDRRHLYLSIFPLNTIVSSLQFFCIPIIPTVVKFIIFYSVHPDCSGVHQLSQSVLAH